MAFIFFSLFSRGETTTILFLYNIVVACANLVLSVLRCARTYTHASRRNATVSTNCRGLNRLFFFFFPRTICYLIAFDDIDDSGELRTCASRIRENTIQCSSDEKRAKYPCAIQPCTSRRYDAGGGKGKNR